MGNFLYSLWPFGIFFRHLGYFLPFDTFCLQLVHFPGFGIMYREKSGNPGLCLRFNDKMV
jgi:hypothetical protein